ncbi:hypothetical protein IAD21_00202 [Abditibacteriota bacterium]|nr:hypothetical protein IAD21_00202 [Abditibacteriota bacterium]
MNRRIALLALALPLVLGALTFGVKWHWDHPPVTPEDLKVRALLSSTSAISIVHRLPNGRTFPRTYYAKVRRQAMELQPFIDALYLSAQPTLTRGVSNGRHGLLMIDCLHPIPPPKDGILGLVVWISPDGHDGQILVSASKGSRTYNLHPLTTKRWLELLSSIPRVGPELQKRMQS